MEQVLYLKTISFNSNGGSKVPEQKLLMGETVTRPADPVKEGSIFAGWFTDNGTFAEEWVFGFELEKDVTLYAKWLDFGIEIDPSEAVISAVAIGYTTAPSRQFTIKNISNTMPTDDLTISLGGSGAGAYILSDTTVSSLLPGETKTITVTLNLGLSIGKYDAFVIVSGSDFSKQAAISAVVEYPYTITNLDFTVTAPVKGAAPALTASGSCTYRFESVLYSGATTLYYYSVSWTPSASTFLASTAYTVSLGFSVTSADIGFANTLAATINGKNAVITNKTDHTVTISYTFPATEGVLNFDISVETITDGNLSIPSGITLSRSNALSKSATISISNAGASSVKWYYDNAQIPTTGNSITLSVSNNPTETVAYNAKYNIVGKHLLTVVVTIGGIDYSGVIEFEVTQ